MDTVQSLAAFTSPSLKVTRSRYAKRLQHFRIVLLAQRASWKPLNMSAGLKLANIPLRRCWVPCFIWPGCWGYWLKWKLLWIDSSSGSGFWQSLWKDFWNILVSAEAKLSFWSLCPLNIEIHVHFMGNSIHMFAGYLSLMYSNAILQEKFDFKKIFWVFDKLPFLESKAVFLLMSPNLLCKGLRFDFKFLALVFPEQML